MSAERSPRGSRAESLKVGNGTRAIVNFDRMLSLATAIAEGRISGFRAKADAEMRLTELATRIILHGSNNELTIIESSLKSFQTSTNISDRALGDALRQEFALAAESILVARGADEAAKLRLPRRG